MTILKMFLRLGRSLKLGENNQPFKRSCPSASKDARGSGVFEFLHGVTNEKDGGVWLYTFYEGIVFLVMHSADPAAIDRWSK